LEALDEAVVAGRGAVTNPRSSSGAGEDRLPPGALGQGVEVDDHRRKSPLLRMWGGGVRGFGQSWGSRERLGVEDRAERSCFNARDRGSAAWREAT